MNEQLRFWDEIPTQHNVFFAVKSDETATVRIARSARELVEHRRLRAKLLRPEHFHVSLFAVGGFSGTCPPAVINAARAIASTITMAPFKVAFDRVASFGGGNGRSPLVLTGGDTAGLVRLQQTLSLAMIKAGVGMRLKTQFTPHLTMMYADRISEFSIEPVSWTVNEFVLIDSLYGQSRHVLLDRWPL